MQIKLISLLLILSLNATADQSFECHEVLDKELQRLEMTGAKSSTFAIGSGANDELRSLNAHRTALYLQLVDEMVRAQDYPCDWVVKRVSFSGGATPTCWFAREILAKVELNKTPSKSKYKVPSWNDYQRLNAVIEKTQDKLIKYKHEGDTKKTVYRGPDLGIQETDQVVEFTKGNKVVRTYLNKNKVTAIYMGVQSGGEFKREREVFLRDGSCNVEAVFPDSSGMIKGNLCRNLESAKVLLSGKYSANHLKMNNFLTLCLKKGGEAVDLRCKCPNGKFIDPSRLDTANRCVKEDRDVDNQAALQAKAIDLDLAYMHNYNNAYLQKASKQLVER